MHKKYSMHRRRRGKRVISTQKMYRLLFLFPLNSSPLTNVFVLQNSPKKMQKSSLKSRILEKLQGQIEILSTCNLLCWKVTAAVCCKTETPCSDFPEIFYPRRGWYIHGVS